VVFLQLEANIGIVRNETTSWNKLNVCNIKNWEKDTQVSLMCANQIFVMFNKKLEIIVCAVWSIIKVPIII
jgi:hypothetical protein